MGYYPMFQIAKKSFLLIPVLYLGFHFLTLSSHPFVHSDEAWLASLTRAMLHEHSISAVEDSFRATPRYPHALKILFHAVQAPFIAISWRVFSARLPSLLAGFAVLYLSVKIAAALGFYSWTKYLAAVLVAVDPQFWYASHMARSEMLLCLLMLSALYLKLRPYGPVVVALPLAASVFVHPNAFVIAMPIGLIYLWECLMSVPHVTVRLARIRSTLIFTAVLGAAAFAALFISFSMDPLFLVHFRRFGESVGTGDSLIIKILELPRFFGKMWFRTSGTYYLADARPFLGMGVLGWFGTVLVSIAGRLRRKHFPSVYPLILLPAALAAGTTVIGKFGPPTLIFFFVPAYLLFAGFLSLLLRRDSTNAQTADSPISDSRVELRNVRFYSPEARRTQRIRPLSAIPVFLAVMSLIFPVFSTVQEILSSQNRESYADYGAYLKSQIDDNHRVLANLNTAFHFEYDRLVIWRDLAALKESGQSLEDFLNQQNVGWVVLPAELDLIYQTRPVWNTLYGAPDWYPEVLELLQRRGTLVGIHESPVYGMRIVPFMYRKSGLIRIYRI